MPELIGHRKRPLRCAPADFQVDTESAAVRRTCDAGSSAEGSPRARRRATCNPAQLRNYVPADCKSRRKIKDSHAETPKPTIPNYRSKPRRSQPSPKEVSTQYGISAEEASQPRRSRPAGSIGLCGGSYCRRLSSPRLRQGGGKRRIHIRIDNEGWRRIARTP